MLISMLPQINRNDDFLPRTAFWIRDHSTTIHQPPPHRHEYFQVYVNLSGTTEHELGATVRPIVPGTVAFIMPLRVHRIRHTTPAEFFVINFRLDFLRPESAADTLELEDVPITAMPELAPFLFQEHLDFVLHGDELAEARELCLRMRTENRQHGFFATEFIRADLFRLIGTVCRRYEVDLKALATTNMLQGSRRASLARVSRYMREHLAEGITLADAAAAAFLSPSYLAHLLKRETGRTFVEILTDQRMDIACRMLLGTTRPIAEIAAAVGIHDEAYFSRRFRQLQGVSPSRWRNERLKGDVRGDTKDESAQRA